MYPRVVAHTNELRKNEGKREKGEKKKNKKRKTNTEQLEKKIEIGQSGMWRLRRGRRLIAYSANEIERGFTRAR